MVVICKRRTLPAELIENCFELINLLIVFACWTFLSAVAGSEVSSETMLRALFHGCNLDKEIVPKTKVINQNQYPINKGKSSNEFIVTVWEFNDK